MTKQQMKKAHQMIDNMKTVEDFNNIRKYMMTIPVEEQTHMYDIIFGSAYDKAEYDLGLKITY